MKLVANICEKVLLNVEKAYKKQKWAYVLRKGKKSFVRPILGGTLVKMNKWGHNKVISFSCREGLYVFVGYVDGNGDVDFDERGRICIICIIEDSSEH